MQLNPTLFYTVCADGKIDVTFHELTKSGLRLQRSGQRFMLANSWSEVLPVFKPEPTVSVKVRYEGDAV